MTHDEAEFLMSQQLDGTLDAADAQRLRAAIESDTMLAAMWTEHQAIDAVLRSSRVAVADADADELCARIAAAIDDEGTGATAAVEPLRSFKLSDYRWTTPLAAAATLAIGLTIGIVAARSGSHATPTAGPIARVTEGNDNSTVAVASAIPTISLTGGADEAIPATTNGVASFSVGTPSNLSSSYVASLYVSDRSATDHVVIQGLGRAVTDTFD